MRGEYQEELLKLLMVWVEMKFVLTEQKELGGFHKWSNHCELLRTGVKGTADSMLSLDATAGTGAASFMTVKTFWKYTTLSSRKKSLCTSGVQPSPTVWTARKLTVTVVTEKLGRTFMSSRT